MSPSTICEARVRRGAWEIISVEQALKLNTTTEKRCVECHGRVRAHKPSRMGAGYFKHTQRHTGCRLGDCYDGKDPRLHPVAVI